MKKNEKERIPTGQGEIKVGKYGIIGALFAALCCIGPLVPILLGLGGATALFGLDRYKPWFIGLGLLILALASWFAVRKQNRCCAVKSMARNVKTVATIFCTGIGAYLLLQFAVVPALSSIASSKVAADHENANQIADGQDVKLKIDGMTCAGCAVGVESAFLEISGVSSAKVDWKTGHATVRIDAEKIQPDDLLKAKVEAQYTVHLTDETNKQ
jgi:copper chaperone CopZ